MAAQERAQHLGHGRMLANRIRKNRRRLRNWLRSEGVSCYRLYDRDIPEIPLAVDDYEGHLHIAEYARPHGRDEAGHTVWLTGLCEVLGSELGVAADRIHLKRRERQRGRQQYERVGQEKRSLIVNEGGHRFAINLTDYLDTGLFLDHRTTRRLVAEEAAGRHMLNLFAYTGAFTIYAGAAGARSTTTIDMSASYLSRAAENLKLNGLDGREHRLERADVRRWLAEAAGSGARYDLVVLDPPTFSNSARTDRDFDLQRDQVALLQAVRRLLATGGIVWFSTNFRGFKLDEGSVEGFEAVEMSERTVPADFRNRRVHRSWRLVLR